MRVYFGVCGIGLGHVGRCIPVAQKLKEMGNEILFSTYSDAVNYVKQENFPLAMAPPIGFVVKPDGSVDFRLTTADPGPFAFFIFLRQLTAEIQFMKAFRPDVVLSDSRASSIMAAELLGVPKITMLNLYRITIPRRRRFLRLARIGDAGIITLIGRVWAMGRHVLIPDFPPPYTISAGNLRIPPTRRKKIRLIGPMLPVKPDALPDKEEVREKLGFDKADPIIFAPISGSVKEKAYFIDILRQCLRRFPSRYRIVMSLGYPNSSAEPIESGNMTLYRWLPNRFEFLKACDLVIARPGLGTLTQSLCYGRPLILVPTPNHTEQLNNAARAKELGIAKGIPQERLSYDVLLSSVQEVLAKERYRKRAEQIQKEASKYDAIETVVETITGLAEEA